MTESGGTKSFLGQLSSVACLSSQLLETGFVPSLPSGTVWDSGSHQQAVSPGAKGQVGVSSTLRALLTQPCAHALAHTHLPGWLTFPADLLMQQINQSHSLICRPPSAPPAG